MWVTTRKSIVAHTTGAALLFAVACSPVMRVHGYAPEQGELEMLIVGADTKSSIEDSIGAPSDSGLREDGSWYYVESTVQHLAFLAPEVVERRVIVLDFDNDGVLSEVSRFGMEEGRLINLQTRVTPTESRRTGVLQRLIGNVGSITPPLPTN